MHIVVVHTSSTFDIVMAWQSTLKSLGLEQVVSTVGAEREKEGVLDSSKFVRGRSVASLAAQPHG